MTSPADLANGPHADALAALEEEAARVIGEPIRKALQRAISIVMRLEAHPRPTRYAIERDRREVAALIRQTSVTHVSKALATYVSRAFDLGVAQAWVEATGKRPDRAVRPRKDAALQDALSDTRHTAAGHLIAGAVESERATRVPALRTAVLQAFGAAVTSERTARWVVNRSAARGVESVARELGADLLWIAERDACLHCLAYSGEVAKDGALFPGGLSFAKKPLKTGPIPYPPLHPNCRCRITPWLGTREGSGTNVELPEALKREARRSVVLGIALPSESPTERLNAADRLLKSGAKLPASVIKRGRQAIQRGQFGRRPRL